MIKSLVFLCGARDYHAIDWYKRAKNKYPNLEIEIITDLIQGEGFKKIVSSKDKIYKLLIIDSLLLNKQSSLGNYWRNILKIIVFPIQVLLLKIYSFKHNKSIYYCHGMYYLLLAKFAGLKYVGRPQGSEILIRPYKSLIYRFFAKEALKAAETVIVDSPKMKNSIHYFVGSASNTEIITNGIDLKTINKLSTSMINKNYKREGIVSIRGLTSLYQIQDIINSRKYCKMDNIPINFIYPFHEERYKESIINQLSQKDNNIGRLNKMDMYKLLLKTKLVISIPNSDSSPRSVFESIFCGCIVAISYNQYYEQLPESLKARILIVDLGQKDWFATTVFKSNELQKSSFNPCRDALRLFDQERTIETMANYLSI